MNSYGKAETEQLKVSLHRHLDRLVEQLADLETSRDDLEDDDYLETRQDTIDQLKEFNDNLNKILNGDITLISSLGAIQMATRAAISEAFKTPEVIRLFARKEPEVLRERLKVLEDSKQNKLSLEDGERQKAEILIALRQLGDQLSSNELQFLEKHNDISNAFTSVGLIDVNE